MEQWNKLTTTQGCVLLTYFLISSSNILTRTFVIFPFAYF